MNCVSMADDREMAAPLIDRNDQVTGHIISSTIGGKNGEPKQTVSYMAERVVGTGPFGIVFQAIPPVTRMALGHNTWVTVLCRKLKDWWHWVAEGDLPIVASHGTEIEAYNTPEPEVRVVILKALCDIRVEQEDIRSYIDDSIKRGIHLSVFRKERIGGDSTGISYRYYRLYREIRKVEVKKGKGKTVAPIYHSSYKWEAIATNFDEFVNVSEKLLTSKNRTEVAVGKKLKNDMLPEIEKEHKRKEKLLKKQHRQALMLDNVINVTDKKWYKAFKSLLGLIKGFLGWSGKVNRSQTRSQSQP